MKVVMECRAVSVTYANDLDGGREGGLRLKVIAQGDPVASGLVPGFQSFGNNLVDVKTDQLLGAGQLAAGRREMSMDASIREVGEGLGW